MLQKPSAFLTTLLVAGLVAAGAAPASARVVERITYGESFGDVLDNFCGVELPVAYTTEFSGSGTIRTRGKDELEWHHDRMQAVETFTHDGMTVTIVSPGTLLKDHDIVDNGDGTIDVTVLLTGVTRVIGSDGKLLARDAGQFRLLLTIDSESGEIIRDALVFGPRGRSDDICSAILAHWGV
jgi:hypothetical protein